MPMLLCKHSENRSTPEIQAKYILYITTLHSRDRACIFTMRAYINYNAHAREIYVCYMLARRALPNGKQIIHVSRVRL